MSDTLPSNAQLADELEAADVETILESDLLDRVCTALRATHEPCAECQRMREGLQLIATDEHRLMNITARQTAASILAGKPSGVTTTPPPEADVATLEQAWKEIDALIRRGELSGNGCDQQAERNGIVLAANKLQELIHRASVTKLASHE